MITVVSSCCYHNMMPEDECALSILVPILPTLRLPLDASMGKDTGLAFHVKESTELSCTHLTISSKPRWATSKMSYAAARPGTTTKI